MTVNVSAENIDKVFQTLTRAVSRPSFLILEHAARGNGLLRDYYTMGVDYPEFMKIYNRYKAILIQDSLVTFGFASYKKTDQVVVDRYKVFLIRTDHPRTYEKLLQRLGYKKFDRLTTVWDTFTPETPGHAKAFSVGKLDIYAIIEELKPSGLHFAGRRVEK